MSTAPRLESIAMKRRAAMALACVVAVSLPAGAAWARDTGHLLRAADVVEEMRQDGAGADIAFAFGADAGALADSVPNASAGAAPSVAAFADLPFANPNPSAHGRVIPAATGFAVASDVEAVPVQAAQRDRCAQEHVRCWLYAVDDRVVWSADVEQRVGLSSQLPDDRFFNPGRAPAGTPPRARP